MIRPITVHPWSMLSLGEELAVNHLVAAASAVWPSANRALYIPFWLPTPITAVQMFSYNGATASGNIDVGIYAEDGTRIVSAGSTAQAGTNALQAFDITDTLIGPGRYYLAIAMDNTTGTLFQAAYAARFMAGHGCFTQASAFPLPAVATFATSASSSNVAFGFSTRAVL